MTVDHRRRRLDRLHGVCLTVVASGVEGGKTWFDVDAAAETLGMTTAKHWARARSSTSSAR